MNIRVALTVNNAFDVWVWRRPLVAALRRAGAEVMVVAPPGPWLGPVAKISDRIASYPLDRRGLNPLAEARSAVALYHIYRRWQPVIAHHFTIKPNFYGTLAARLARVPVVIATVTGLGYIWAEDGLKARLLRATVGPAYRWVLDLADAVIYLNEEDRQTLGGRQMAVIPGEGIDLTEFCPEAVPPERRLALRQELGLKRGAPLVLLVGRMIWPKGIFEFVEAARRVRRARPDVTFLLVGPSDEGNPAQVPIEDLQSWEAAGIVRYLGIREDVRDLMAISDVVVLPSYREGLPRVLVEAAAMGKPLVATDVPGCREVVQDGVNGFLVPPQNVTALARAIETLLEHPELRVRFGMESRRLAETKFSDRDVVGQVLGVYAELLAAQGLAMPDGFQTHLKSAGGTITPPG